MPTGMLTRKTSRQLEAVISRPPSGGPIPAASAATADQIATACMRSSRRGPRARSPASSARASLRRLPERCARPPAARARRHSAQRRGGREGHQRKQEHPPAAKQVGELSPAHEERGEDDVVRVEHPRDAGQRAREFMRDARHRDVDDRGVDESHERPQHRDREHRARRRYTPGSHRSRACLDLRFSRHRLPLGSRGLLTIRVCAHGLSGDSRGPGEARQADDRDPAVAMLARLHPPELRGSR